MTWDGHHGLLGAIVPGEEPASRALVLAGRLSVALGTLAAWEGLTAAGALDPFFFSRPSAIALRVADWLASGTIWPHLVVTLEETFLALVIGAAAGIAIGFLLARVWLLGEIFDPYLRVLNALPRVVLAPIFLLWFGLGIWSKVALGVTLVFFVVFYNTYQGIRDVDSVVLNNARLLGASEGQLVRHVLLPSALGWIFSSMHVSIGFALVGAVVGEYLGAAQGIGYVISQAEGVFDTTGVFAGMTVLSAIVLLLAYGVARLERRLLRWKEAAGS